MSNRPNFLFIMTDQHRADWLGVTGHSVVKTPHIDSIADGGTVFDRFYVANPVCMPNRAAFMTGRHSSVNSVRTNGIPLSLDSNTFVQRLADEGYDTSLHGKAHFQNFVDFAFGEKTEEPDSPEAEAKRYYTKHDYDSELPSTWGPGGKGEVPLPYYGFGHVDLVTGHGDRCGGQYARWLNSQVEDVATLIGPKNQIEHGYTCPQAVRTRVPEELYSTRFIEEKAAGYLSDPARKDAPFFTFVSFPDPHHPFNPPGKYWDMYDPDDFEVPKNFEAEGGRLLKWLREEQGTVRGPHVGPNPVSRREVQEAMALTAGMITMIDDAVGRLLQTLKENGLDENTIVVFNSDHGDLLGDHGLILKGGLHYQSTIRVPMIWNDPTKTQTTRSGALASTVDIAPTVLAAAGVAPYAGIQGCNLSEALTGGESGQDALLIEEENNNPMCFSANPRFRTIQTGQYRMTMVVGENEGELYDLKEDPGEMNNLFDSPDSASLRADLMTQLADLMGQAADPSPRRLYEA